MGDGGGWHRRRAEKVFGLPSPVAAFPPDNGDEPGDDLGGVSWRRVGDA